MLPISLAALVLATSVLAMSGCGGSSKTDSATTSAAVTTQTPETQPTTATAPHTVIQIKKGTPLPRSVWIAKGDAICARAYVERHSQVAKTEEDMSRLAPQIYSYDHNEAVALSKLTPPAGMESDWKTVIANVQKIAEYAITVGKYAQVKQFQTARPIMVVAGRLQAQITAITTRDGFKKCPIL